MPTQRIARGVTKFTGTSYRAFASVAGKNVVEYFKTPKEALEWRAQKEKLRVGTLKPGASRSTKSKFSRHQELPVTVYEAVRKYTRADGTETTTPVVRTEVIKNGTIHKSFQVTFNGAQSSRTREEAVKLLLKKREDFVNKNARLFNVLDGEETTPG